MNSKIDEWYKFCDELKEVGRIISETSDNTIDENEGFRYVLRLIDENVDIKIQIKKLRNELANLETEDLENKLKDFFKKYDPKFKDQEENQEDF